MARPGACDAVNLVPINALPVAAASRATLARTKGIDGCIVYVKDGAPRVLAFGPGCDAEDMDAAVEQHPDAHAAWVRAAPVNRTGRTGLALTMLDANPSSSVYAAAKAAQVDPSAVFRALRRREARGVCSCCGQLLPVQKPT